MNEYEKLLLQNKAWAKERLDIDPDYFNRQAHVQKPEFLWIGCSDSRVPANEVTNTQPGEIFVHRNVANLVVNTDLNMLSVLKFAVEVLEIKHVIVSGHYGCGGIKAAMTNNHYGLLNKWLRNIKDVYRLHSDELIAIEDNEIRTNRLVELNIIEQVYNLAKTSIIQKSWAKNQSPILHGSVYSLENGIMNDLITLDSLSSIPDVYRFNFDEDETDD